MQHKHLIPISVAFQAASLAAFMVRESAAAALCFISACAVFAFLAYMDRQKVEASTDISARVATLEARIGNMEMSRVF